MNRFTAEKKRHFLLRQTLTAAAVFCAAVFFLLYGTSSLSKTADSSQAESLQRAIVRSAVHCYATEGRYPESLDYLAEHYGISWDAEKYLVDYEIIASNQMPGVTVISLDKKEESR